MIHSEKVEQSSKMDNNSKNPTQENDVLNEEVEDLYGGPENVNVALLALLQTMQKNMNSRAKRRNLLKAM